MNPGSPVEPTDAPTYLEGVGGKKLNTLKLNSFSAHAERGAWRKGRNQRTDRVTVLGLVCEKMTKRVAVDRKEDRHESV